MSDGRKSLCGNGYHSQKDCADCQRKRYADYDAANPRCSMCRMRFAVNPKGLTEFYNPLPLKGATVAWLENAARTFDAESDELYTAAEFLAWLKPDLLGRTPPIPETSGKAVRAGGGSPRHNLADPIPYYNRKDAA